MGGYLAIIAVGLLLGWLSGWWNRFGRDLRSNLNVALYASGFFATMLAMRSMLWLTTAMLPTLALWLYIKTRQRKPQLRATQSFDRSPSV
jgi:NhaP-type Na+/H+ or K+/H+ antiporter